MVMASIYAECGLYDEAFEELDYLLSLGSVFTTNDLMWHRSFDVLRDDPRFKALIQKYSQTTAL
jgi:hypothetical protein